MHDLAHTQDLGRDQVWVKCKIICWAAKVYLLQTWF